MKLKAPESLPAWMAGIDPGEVIDVPHRSCGPYLRVGFTECEDKPKKKSKKKKPVEVEPTPIVPLEELSNGSD